MSYKLICIDMDGTLLDSNKKIDERTIDAIRKASEKGVKVVICTGRLFTSAEYYAELVGIKTPIISANGAFIRDKDRNEVIYKSILGKEKCKRVLTILKKHGLCPNFHTPTSVFTDDENSSYTAYMKFNKTAPENAKINLNLIDNWDEVFDKYEDDILKCIIVDENIESLKVAKEEMTKEEGLEVVSSFINNFEVMQKGVSKGRAVEVIAGYYNINREDVICIGDNENDLSMIEYAGLGVAMENGEDMVKEVANYVTDTNDNYGVAKVIEKFILGEEYSK